MAAVTDTDADQVLLELFLSPERRANPYPAYRQLREQAPVLRSSMGPIVVSSYDHCLFALRDPRLGRGTSLDSEKARSGLGFSGFDTDPELREMFFGRAGGNMLFADPPDHTRLRKLVNRAFTPRRVAELQPAISQLVERHIDAVVEAGVVDIMETLAFPLPVSVIGELVGVPESDRAGFQPLIRTAGAALDPGTDPEALRAATAAMEEARSYFRELLAHRRRTPADDLLSALIAACDGGDALSDDEVISTAVLLFSAGFETTTNLIGNGLLALLQHPEQQQRWRDDPSIAPTAVDELLRWDSPVQLNRRTALAPADIAGEPLEIGDSVVVLQGAANRDPDRFDQPDTLDLERPNNHPVSFGWGIHHCLGAPLARLEGIEVFNALLARCRSIEPRFTEPQWRTTLTLRGLATLPVEVSS